MSKESNLAMPRSNELVVMPDGCMPAPLNRRSLLTKSVSLGAAAQVGLLSGGVVGALSANAAASNQVTDIGFLDYGENINTNPGTYTRKGKTYSFWIINFNNNVIGASNRFNYGKNITLIGSYTFGGTNTVGLIYDRAKELYYFLDHIEQVSPRRFIYYVQKKPNGTKAIPANEPKYPGDMLRRRLNTVDEWDLPSGASAVAYYSTATDCDADVFSYCRFRNHGNYFVRFTTTLFVDGAWTLSEITQVTGTAMAEIEKAFSDYTLEIKKAKINYGTATVTAMVTGCAVVAGLVSDFAVSDDVAAWTIATGAALAIGSNVAAVSATYVGAATAAAATRSLFITVRKHYHGKHEKNLTFLG